MADYLGVNTSGGTTLDQLVDAYRSTQQSKVDVLNQKKTTLETRRNFINNLNTRMNSVVSQLDNFTAENASEKFVTRSVASSKSDVLTASVAPDASVDLNSVFVEQIAVKDVLITDRLNLKESFSKNSRAIGNEFNFTMSIGEKSGEFKVQLDADETNESAMRKIVSAVNSNDSLNIRASFIKDTSSTGKISFTSNETGSENQIIIDGKNNALDALGLKTNKLYEKDGERTVATDTKAGYKVVSSLELDSKIQVNGISVWRSSNTIDDVLDGVTLNLLKPQEKGEQAVTLSTDIDTKAVEDLLKPLLTEFNNLLSFLGANRAQQRSDPAISSLFGTLRGVVSESISSTQEGAPNFLMSIGITVNSNGSLSMTDTTKLKEFLADDPQKVADLFTSEDGFVAKINNAIESFVGDGGLIRSRRSSITEQINYTDERTSQVQSRIDQQAEALRSQYTSYLETLYEAQNQLNYLYTMPSSSGSGYDSLVAAGY